MIHVELNIKHSEIAWMTQTLLLLTVPGDGKHSLWNMCLQWKTTTLKGLAMSATQVSSVTKKQVAFQMQHDYKTLAYRNINDLPDGKIVAWHDSQIFSSEKKSSNNSVKRCNLKVFNVGSDCLDVRVERSPLTLTPLICVRCIFCSRDRESATRIFLQPSLNRICKTREKRLVPKFIIGDYLSSRWNIGNRI